MKPLSLSKPHLIVMVGIPGSGKSFFAEHFATTFDAPYVSFDRLRDELFNEPSFSDDESAIITRISDYLSEELFKTRQTFIYEGATHARTERQAIAHRARSNGYEPLFVWVQTESTTARLRALKATKGRPAMSSERFDALLSRFTVPNEAEKAVVISGKHTYASQLKIVLQRLIGPRPTQATTHAAKEVSSPAHISHPRLIGGRHISNR